MSFGSEFLGTAKSKGPLISGPLLHSKTSRSIPSLVISENMEKKFFGQIPEPRLLPNS